MIKTILALSVVAALGAAMPAYAQQMSNNTTGGQVDGHGGGGSQQNLFKADGPGPGYRTQSADGTCYFHTADKVFVVRCRS
jgi:hypothetical protein